MNVHKNARLTPQGRLLLVQRVRSRLDGGRGRRRCGTVGAAGVSLARALSRRRDGGAGGPQLGASALSATRCRPSAWPRSSAAAAAPERPGDRAPAGHAGLDGRRHPAPSRARQAGRARAQAAGRALPARTAGRAAPHRHQEARADRGGRPSDHRRAGDAGYRTTARRDRKRGAGWEAVHVGIDDASRLAYSEVLAGRAQDQRGAVPRARGRLVRPPGRHGRAGHDRQRLGLPQPPWRHACGALALRHIRTRPYTPRTNGKAERFIQTSLREWAYARPFASSHERTAALVPWLEHTTPPGRTPPWPTSRRPPDFANRRSSVRPRAPFLRPDLPSPTTGPPGRRQERRRRPAPAGAKRPCADPPDRSRSNRRAPHARSPEQRSWKRHLARCGRAATTRAGACSTFAPHGSPRAGRASDRRARRAPDRAVRERSARSRQRSVPRGRGESSSAHPQCFNCHFC